MAKSRTTGPRRTSGVTRASGTEQEMRDQEVLRANRELAAYFKGRRTEREARAALRVIKAFIRDRQRRDGATRPPLPGAKTIKTARKITPRSAASDGGERPPSDERTSE